MRYLKAKSRKIAVIYAVGLALIPVALVLGLMLGAGRVGVGEVIPSLLGMGGGSVAETIVVHVRLPRVLATVVCGAALAVSGAIIQGVLANRLASPSIIGVNSGAALAVTVAAACGLVSGWRVSLCAFLGALITVFAVSAAASRLGASRGTVILIGVAINSILGAVSDAIVTFFPEIGIARNEFRIGDFSGVTYSKLVPASIAIAIGLGVAFVLSNELRALTLGDDMAKSLGVNTYCVRAVLLVVSALLAGAAVSIAGLVSFVGLIVPNAIRRVTGTGYKNLLPLCAMYGGGFVALCDTAARVVFMPYEIPVGIIMAFLGAPFFVTVLLRRKTEADV